MRAALVLLLAGGCVTSGTYHAKVAELTKQREADAAAAVQREHDQATKLTSCTTDLTASRARLATSEDELTKTKTDRDAAKRELDDDVQLVALLKQQLDKAGKNTDALLKEKGALTQAMTDAQKRMDEMRKQQAAAEARAAMFRSLVAKLHAMIDSGQLKVVIRDGRMIIALPNDILFDSGKVDVKADGKAALAKVAGVLASIPDRHFLVAGHTDNVPIRTELFPSNWELSTRRAVSVVHYLVEQGMKPAAVAAAGYGEFDPVVANDTPTHRAQNRRIEIVLEPNLSDLPPLE